MCETIIKILRRLFGGLDFVCLLFVDCVKKKKSFL